MPTPCFIDGVPRYIRFTLYVPDGKGLGKRVFPDWARYTDKGPEYFAEVIRERHEDYILIREDLGEALRKEDV